MTENLFENSVFDALTASTHSYQVTYRISAKPTTTGESHARYADLTDRLSRLEGVEPGRFDDRGHTSTSAWIVRFAGSAQQLLDKLRSAVTARFDMLEVIKVVAHNHARLPPPDEAN